jgi:glucosamine 6-phosphate synthetase-like amidotransferase/phosphosugar isomerase protein
MCKILTIAGIKKDKTKVVDAFVKASIPFLTADDKDAVGYAALSDKLYGERWVNVNTAFKSSYVSQFQTKPDGVSVEDIRYNKFGDRFGANHTSAMIVHSRFATCDLGIENTHPFVSQDGNTALIHNGVIKTKGLEYRTSTCDSEGILNEYVKQDVTNKPGNIQTIFNKVNGAFACAVLTKANTGEYFLDLFRNDQYPTLYSSYIPELEATVYATTAEIIENTCVQLGYHMEPLYYVMDNSFIRINAKTGEVIKYIKSIEKEKQERLVAKRKKKGKRK